MPMKVKTRMSLMFYYHNYRSSYGMILFLPKPKEDVGLFVNDVCCQYTQTIFVFDGSGWTILMEGTLGNLFAHTLNINVYILSWTLI